MTKFFEAEYDGTTGYGQGAIFFQAKIKEGYANVIGKRIAVRFNPETLISVMKTGIGYIRKYHPNLVAELDELVLHIYCQHERISWHMQCPDCGAYPK